MKSILVTLMIVMSLWNTNVEKLEAKDPEPFKFRLGTYEYTQDEIGFLPGTKVKPFRGWYMKGYQITPKEVKHKGAIVVFSGGGGGCDLLSAMELTKEGYEVYSMYFFGEENQQPEFHSIPLEFFAELYLHVQRTARSPKPLTIQGGSGGAELGLLLASYFPDQVDNLILYAPSAYVFEGLSEKYNKYGSGHSTFTFGGNELPFIRLNSEEQQTKRMIAMRNKKPWNSYQYGLDHDKNKEKARIDLAPVRANLLLFAGEKDAIWPAADMGREIKANYRGECELVTFEKAGHGFSDDTTVGSWEMGGDLEANVEAKIVSDRIRLQKLAEWTK